MRSSLILVLLCFLSPLMHAQDLEPCFFENTQERYGANQHLMDAVINNIHVGKVDTRQELVIPIVVHVVYRLDSEDIPDEQILEQIEVLNTAFSGESLTSAQVPKVFSSSSTAVNFQFCLADTDPSGMPTSGITRKEVELLNIGASSNLFYNDLGGKDAWDTDRYINIWVAETGGLFIGKASFPGVDPKPEQGIVMDVNFFGGLKSLSGAGIFDEGKTLVHEMGHYFGLEHLWGSDLSDCSSEDGIADTPKTGSTYLNTCLDQSFSCGSTDMTGNYMMYTSDACLHYFTKGQKERMRLILAQYRSDLLSTNTNCDAGFNQEDAFSLKKIQSGPNGILFGLYGTIDPSKAQAMLYDTKGCLLWNKEVSSLEQFYLPMQERAFGMYFLVVSTGEELISERIVWY